MNKGAAQGISPTRKLLRALGYIIFSALIIAAFHALVMLLLYVFFGDKALELSPKSTKQEHDDEQISMSAPDDDEFNAWVRIADPRQWALPDYREGFSAQYASSSRHYYFGADAPYELKRPAIDNQPLAARPLSWQLPPRTEALQQAWEAYTIAPNTPAKRIAPPIAHRVYWRNLATGGSLKPAPELSAAAKARWESTESASLRKCNTIIELSQPEGMQLPRIVVRQSCSDTQLDLAAVSALRAFLLKHPPRHAIPSSPSLFEIDWSY
jgi:hypothetical protein